MEEPCEVHLEEDKVLPEKSNKRKLKTPAQLEALENFYNEHTYPSEEMKAQFAEDNGLSIKQVSGWFCHRRLKDKRKDKACVNGRQDFSSGVIQDHGSGLKQDSCSSNKQGNYRHFDFREVESRRFDGSDYTAPDNAYKNRSELMHTRNYSPVENTFSGSSSTSQEKLFPRNETPYDTENLRYPSRSSDYMLINRGVENKEKMMVSGYLRLQDEIANSAITAVKRQLGRDFCEDGPPLGIEFQPIPPGAFDLQGRDPIHEAYQMPETILQNSHGIPKSRKEPHINTRYPRYHHEMSPQGSYPEAGHIKRTKSKFVHRECTSYPSIGNSSFRSYSKHATGENPTMDNMDESSADDTSMIKSNKNFMRSTKSRVNGVISHSTINNRLRPFSGNFVSGESSVPRLHKYDNPRPCKSQRREFVDAKPLNLVNQRREDFDATDRVAKEENLHRDRRMSKEYVNPLKVKKNQKNDMRVGGRVRGEEIVPQDYVLRTPQPEELLPWRNQIKECEDTAANSSSTD